MKASYQIYLVGGTDGEIDSIRSGTSEDFDYQLPHQDSFSVCECIVGHGRMRKALQAYGSLVVSAKIAFFAPSETALHGYDDPQRWMAKFSKLCGEDASADCWIHVGSLRTYCSLPAIPHAGRFRSAARHSQPTNSH